MKDLQTLLGILNLHNYINNMIITTRVYKILTLFSLLEYSICESECELRLSMELIFRLLNIDLY